MNIKIKLPVDLEKIVSTNPNELVNYNVLIKFSKIDEDNK